MDTATDQGPVAAARDCCDLVLRWADWSVEHRHQHPDVAGALAGAGLHRLAVPAELGGAGTDPMTMMRAIEAVSAADGSAGWTLMIGIEVLGLASGFLPRETFADILAAEPATIMAGGIMPAATARPVEVDGGLAYRVDGRWRFASGIDNAHWWWGGCIVDDGTTARPRRTIQALIPRDELTIHDTWDGAGLAGTGSHDVEAVDVIVPAARTTDLLGTEPTIDHPLFTMPLMSRLPFNKVGVSTGIARAAIDTFVELATSKRPVGGRDTLAERPRAQLAVAEAEATLGGARAWALEVVEELWTRACRGQDVDAALNARVRLACSHAAQAAVDAVDLVHRAAGTTPNLGSHPLQRQLNDVRVVPQQLTVAPHMIEAAGRVMLGLDPDLDLF